MPWLSGILVALCLALALLHAVRLVARRSGAEAVHLAMALGMAAMFAPLDPVPAPVWTAVFATCTAAALAFVARTRDLAGEPGHLLVGSVAMLFMAVSEHVHGGHAGGPGWAAPAALLLAGACAWHALRCAQRFDEPSATGGVLGVRAGAGAHAVMAVGMGAMLLTALS